MFSAVLNCQEPSCIVLDGALIHQKVTGEHSTCQLSRQMFQSSDQVYFLSTSLINDHAAFCPHMRSTAKL